MSEWKYFAFEQPRPEGTATFAEADRPALERSIGEQVALLLSMYGEVVEVDIDVSGDPDIDCPTPFVSIELDSLPLEDDGEFSIGLFPYRGDVFDTRPGTYNIEQTDEDGCIVRSLSVYHQMTGITPQVQYPDSAESVDLAILQELHEGLGLITADYLKNEVPNDSPHNLAMYPCVLAEVRFGPLFSAVQDGMSLN